MSKPHIFYRPRVRAWIDTRGDLHLAGEPDGFQVVLEGLRRLVRGYTRRHTVVLAPGPVPRGRNPVPESGVKRLMETLTFRLSRRTLSVPLAIVRGGACEVVVGNSSVAMLYMGIAEAHDGEGDFSLTIQAMSAKGGRVRDASLWFWGYRNLHGLNAF
jgi:hypothetical protein